MGKYQLIQGDSKEVLKDIPEKSVHCVITDPPYFLDGMGSDWDQTELQVRANKAGIIGSLPVGMKFDPAQGKCFQDFMESISVECLRILKPGGFLVSFSQARLYHRLGIAVENAGFEIRDMLGWKYEGQAKAFSQDHFVKKEVEKGIITKDEGEIIIKRMAGRKTPQLKPQIEPMVLAQKPKEGTFVNNWLKHEVGLVDVTKTLDGKFPGNIMEVPKPNKKEKGENNNHFTVKPKLLIKHLIELLTIEGQVVLDPFCGSGTHGVAALELNRKFIGIEVEQSFIRLSKQRMENI